MFKHKTLFSIFYKGSFVENLYRTVGGLHFSSRNPVLFFFSSSSWPLIFLHLDEDSIERGSKKKKRKICIHLRSGEGEREEDRDLGSTEGRLFFFFFLLRRKKRKRTGDTPKPGQRDREDSEDSVALRTPQKERAD